jgi:hypothetical protein
MASLHFELDTSPLARTVDSVKAHVNGTAAAVTAMEAAVIAAELAAAKSICENVDRGFFMLVKSQISQKAVAAYTEMTAKQTALVQLSKALDNVKRQMEADYNMIARRYTKLFASLNQALETRVRELDRPAMKLAEIKRSLVFDKLRDEGSVFLCASDEAHAVARTALSGKLKQKTQAALQALSRQVHEGELYTRKIDGILSGDPPAPADPEKNINYVPVIFASTQSSLRGGDEYRDKVYTAPLEHLPAAPAIAGALHGVQETLAWRAAGEQEKQLLRKEVFSLVEQAGLDQRTSNEMMRLFDADHWQVLSGSEK